MGVLSAKSSTLMSPRSVRKIARYIVPESMTISGGESHCLARCVVALSGVVVSAEQDVSATEISIKTRARIPMDMRSLFKAPILSHP